MIAPSTTEPTVTEANVDDAIAHMLTAELVTQAARELTDPDLTPGKLVRANLTHRLMALVADEMHAAFVALGERT